MDVIRPETILDISTDRFATSSDSLSEIYPNSLAKSAIDLTSPLEPFAINKNLDNSLLLPRSNPSAMLFIIDTAALCIWSLKEKSLEDLKSE